MHVRVHGKLCYDNALRAVDDSGIWLLTFSSQDFASHFLCSVATNDPRYYNLQAYHMKFLFKSTTIERLNWTFFGYAFSAVSTYLAVPCGLHYPFRHEPQTVMHDRHYLCALPDSRNNSAQSVPRPPNPLPIPWALPYTLCMSQCIRISHYPPPDTGDMAKASGTRPELYLFSLFGYGRRCTEVIWLWLK